jgi:serine/threonine protein phosphatase PrpC
LIRDKNTLAKLKDRKDAEKYFKKIFGIIQDKYKKKSNDFDLSGTCAICVLMVDIHCFVINLGDSRAVIGAKQGEQKVAYQMSIDHKADREDEKRRIESNKGIVSSGKDGRYNSM